MLLFCGFFSDSWKVADERWFVTFQRDDESMILGRLVKSRQDGTFSAGGLMGLGGSTSTPVRWNDETFDYQYRAYLNDLKFGPYGPYLSEIGAHTLLFRLLDVSMPFRSEVKLALLYILTAMLTALTLTLIVLWFWGEFGVWVGAMVLGSMVLSQWLVVFGKNLYWSIWALYLPMVVIMYLRPNGVRTRRDSVRFGALVFASVMLACLVRTFAYITSTLIMMMVPFVYYSIRDGWSLRDFVKGTLVAVCASSLAGVLSVAILLSQVASAEGTVRAGVDHMVARLHERTVADPTKDREKSSLSDRSVPFDAAHVVQHYMIGRYFELDNYLGPSTSFVRRLLGARYYHLITLFALASAALSFSSRRDAKRRRQNAALVVATWFSILAPMSWFVIFAAHSYVHTHMNFILWQMPFTFFGFAVCGLALREMVGWVRSDRRTVSYVAAFRAVRPL